MTIFSTFKQNFSDVLTSTPPTWSFNCWRSTLPTGDNDDNDDGEKSVDDDDEDEDDDGGLRETPGSVS